MNKTRLFIMLVTLGLCFTQISNAGYNANMKGIVTAVVTYAGGGHIYFRLHNQPTSHPLCKTDYFAIHSGTPPDSLGRMLSRLLIAYTTGETVNIDCHNAGDCAHSRIRMWRVGEL